MTDLMHLMSGLVDRQGKLKIPGIYDHVAKLEEAEAKLYQPIDFDMVCIVFKSDASFVRISGGGGRGAG